MAAYVISAKAAGEQVTDYLRQELHATQREINECNEQMNVCGDDITSSNRNDRCHNSQMRKNAGRGMMAVFWGSGGHRQWRTALGKVVR